MSSSQITCVLVDDEENATKVMSKFLESYCPNVDVLAIAHNMENGIKAIEENNPQLVFLDIEMPNGTGFDLLERMGDKRFHVVFVTAYDHYAIQAIKNQAIDYILKPIDIDDLVAAVEKVKKKIKEPTSVKDVLNRVKIEEKAKLAVPTLYGHKFIDPKHIVHVRAEGSYSVIYTENEGQIMISKNLKSIENALKQDNFLRVHRSHIVNLDKVTEFHKNDGGYLVMETDERVEIGSSNRAQIVETLNSRLNFI
ncbi:MAG: LytTR family DNA-binding domain-containing protein [Salibacteraceae bacterium]|nr:LytTR family DNA-binding domain-containing protein [Salibacteraceae bacterium]|tara:strand:- start:17482 stop:18240 length:759 start_codon:yes stop_codon:yes gene_type:complete